MVDAFICFQKNGLENFSVNGLVSIFGIAPSRGYDCLVFASRLHLVVQTTGQKNIILQIQPFLLAPRR